MEYLDRMGEWLAWLWSGIDWIWAGAWVLAGILLTHLLWWRRSARLADQGKKIVQGLANLDNRQREIRKLSEDLSRREGALRKMEENLKLHTDQLKPQIEQVRSWLDQVLRNAPRGGAPPAEEFKQPVGKAFLN